MKKNKPLKSLDLKSSRILVTGATGFLGSHIVDILRERNYPDVTKADSSSRLQFIDSARRLLKNRRPDVVIHAAGWNPGMTEMENRSVMAIEENLAIGMNTMRAAAEQGVRKFVLAGCVYEYPGNCPFPLVESDLWNGHPAGVTAPYGVGKRLLGSMLQAYHADGAIPEAAYLLLSDLYGPRMKVRCRKAGPVACIIDRMFDARRDGKTCQITMSNKVTRDLLYVRDAARGVLMAADTVKNPDPINLSSGKSVSMWALARMVKWKIRHNGMAHFNPHRAQDIPSRVVSNLKAQNELGWSPLYSLRGGLDRTLQWYQSTFPRETSTPVSDGVIE